MEGEFETGAVVAAFEEADRLVIDADGVGEGLASDSALGAEYGDAVVEAAFSGSRWEWSVVLHDNILRIHNIYVN